MNDYNLTEILEYIDPSTCSYQEWINVGMALKHEGYTVSDWDMWSMKDVNRYHSGECAKKWATFQGSSAPVTAGTIIQMAKENGYHYENVSAELDWDSEIGSKDELVVVDRNWLERSEIHIPEQWNPTEQIITYLETLFEPDENVGYVTESWEHDGKFLPSKGCYDRTAGQLIKELYQCKGDIGSVLGDYNSEVGAWIRFNPLDGKGVKNENVTEFRYALVESDTMDISAQKAIITELELPVAALVYSGKKSLHAIVKIDASTYEEYKKRVDYLYNVCNKNGLKLDIQNRNPSRLSRMPGVMRNDKKQYLLDTNIGKENWNEWREWIESVNDDLPDPESMADVWDNLPELAPPLIDGVLRQGHKMLIAGPSKAGKSYALIELCCAIAEGEKWLEWNCTQGKVMYVNLELDRASCLHRFKDVYTALGIAPDNLSNIDIWNLRGRSVPMDKLAPKLIRRASKKNYIAIIIDPIYKVITGDENSADQMAHFCNQFDKVCTELGCAVIYCHHHSKGAQGGKRSMDRASGSGVFARDPDALIDLVELELNDDILKQEKNKAVCKVCEGWLYKYDKLYHASQDDLCSETQMLALCREYLENDAYECVIEDVGKARKTVESRSAWRIEGTLREFPKFAPVNLWFKYPVHNIDNIGVLKDIAVDDGMPTWKKNFSKKKTDAERKTERKNSLETAFEACGIDDNVTVKAMAEYMGVTEKTVRNRLKEHGGFWIDEGQVGKK
ncbi:AAA family ATPase [Hominilimicola sp.]|uniref:AAA family ATPase n=1 Tax=Hominilimicola sp. TaxID=3073571 RepID=UPI00307C5D93